MRRQRIHLAASRIHKWLGLIIGAQLLIWFTSGLLMSFLPVGQVRGEHLVDRNIQTPIQQDVKLADPRAIAAKAGVGVESISFRMIDGRVMAEAITGKITRLFDGQSGMPLPPIDAKAANRIAQAAWKGQQKFGSGVGPVNEESTEYRGPLPAWQVRFEDPDETRVYVAAQNGKIMAVRTGTWRVYDFFWGLHIMDWKNHENFNTPWLIAFALGGLILGLAGTALLIFRWPFRRRR